MLFRYHSLIQICSNSDKIEICFTHVSELHTISLFIEAIKTQDQVTGFGYHITTMLAKVNITGHYINFGMGYLFVKIDDIAPSLKHQNLAFLRKTMIFHLLQRVERK